MILYGYDKQGVFTAEIEPQIDVKETKATGKVVYLQPARSTSISPPEKLAENEKPVFFEAENKWVGIEDHRGKILYHIETKEAVRVDSLGKIPPTLTELLPPEFSVWKDVKWVVDFNQWVEGKLKFERNGMLTATDYTQLADARKRMGDTLSLEWDEYRQELCDLVEKITEVVDPIPWPTPPVYKKVTK